MVDFGGYDEVIFGEVVDFVGLECDLDFILGEVDIRMVIFFFC